MAFVTLLTTGAEPKTYELNKPRIVAGRDSRCDIHIDNLAVSKQHLEIVQEAGTFILRDLGSSNKTFINSIEVKEHLLKDGDEAVLGPYRLKFSNPNSAPAKSADIPTASDGFEPTLQLPPEMIRKKLEEMQREKTGRAGAAELQKPMTAKDYAAQASPPPTQGSADDQKRAGTVTAMIIGAIVLIVIVNVVLFIKFYT
ncbi:MAG TPA: FHA domain-containing protein [Planctomycetota bacterium]|nr:FHA domain-containing protein [Planctomycetota bacterium]